MKCLFICYPKCSTCKKAQKFLNDNNIQYDFRHIVEDNPNFEELQKWIKISQKPVNKFFNYSGNLYKSMNLKERVKEMSEEEMTLLLASNGMLVKRPLLIGEDFILIGFNEKAWGECVK